MTRVAVFARSELARAGLESLLANVPGIALVGHASTIDELSRVYAAAAPDVVVIDAEGSDGDSGVNALAFSDIRDSPGIVLLTDDPADAHPFSGRRGAGLGVLPRHAGAAEIGAAIQAASLGLIVTHQEFADRDAGASPVRSTLDGAVLTPREIEVLRMLAAGLPNKAIANRLGVSAHTVKFHVGSIMSKLRASSRTEAVTEGIRRGLIYV